MAPINGNRVDKRKGSPRRSPAKTPAVARSPTAGEANGGGAGPYANRGEWIGCCGSWAESSRSTWELRIPSGRPLLVSDVPGLWSLSCRGCSACFCPWGLEEAREREPWGRRGPPRVGSPRYPGVLWMMLAPFLWVSPREDKVRTRCF